MQYGAESIENRFEEFVAETNKKIEALEAQVRLLEKEIRGKETNKPIVNITNQDIKSSLGATIKTIGDIVKK